MTNTVATEANIANAIRFYLKDESRGRRSVRWLSEQTGIPRGRLSVGVDRPLTLTVGELIRIADAFGVTQADLYREEAA